MSFVSCWLFFVQPRDLVGDVDRGVLVHVAQLVDLLLQLGDRLLEIEKGLLHRAIIAQRGRGGGATHTQIGPRIASSART